LSEYQGTGGGDGGGQGTFDPNPPDLCRGVVVNAGLLEYLTTIKLLMFGNHKVGLYSNDRKPKLADDVSLYVPCNFSGYDGLRLTYGWTFPVLVGDRAFTHSEEFVWSHSGGPVGNWVYGYYVVNVSGELKFAERFCNGPFLVAQSGRQIKLTLMMTSANESEVS